MPFIVRGLGGAVFFAIAGLTPLAAQVRIQFDFGATGAYNGTNSPGFAAGDFTTGQTTWNQITGNTSSGLVYADGSAASGITVQVGYGDTNVVIDDTNAVNWSQAPATGTDAPLAGSVFVTSLGEDNVYAGGQVVLGARVTGLSPGTYHVYAIGRGVTGDQRLFQYHQVIGVGDATTTSFADLGGSTLLGGSETMASWQDGVTYRYSSVTVNSTSDYVIFLTQAAYTSNTFGNGYAAIQGLQLAQVSAVPEPAAT